MQLVYEHKQLKVRKLYSYVLIRHLPVGSITVGEHLPHQDPVTPDIAGGGECALCDRFWSGPSDRYQPALCCHNKHIDNKSS